MPWMGITDVTTYVLALLVFMAIPGPGTFTLLTAVGKGGVRAGYITLAGLSLGDQVLMWLAAAGVAALLQANPLVFKAVQYAGAAYLLWVGLQLLRSRDKPTAAAQPVPAGHYFRHGLLITLLNPKAIMFYMAFFPLFIDPKANQGVATFATMAALILLVTLAYCSLLILVGHAMAGRFARHPWAGRWMQRFAGTFLVGFGVKLGLSG